MKTYALVVSVVCLFVLASCATGGGIKSTYEPSESVYTLQILHFADIDGNEITALDAVENFSGLVDVFSNDAQYANSTLVLSSGDNIIPGPRFYAAEQSLVRALTGSNEPGHVDIAFLNALGVKASVLGNHELDVGPGEFADALSSEERNGVVFPGSEFVYLSTNTDFTADSDTAELVGTNGASVEDLKGKLAGYAFATVNGEKIGLVGASTPLLPSITSVGSLTFSPSNSDWTIDDLAAVIQPSVDALIAQGINKVILLAHMQQISVEKELATKLSGVDIIIGGGSNTRMGDENDKLFGSDGGFQETYPYETSAADGLPTLVINVDGDYKYLGRLVANFDADGVLVVDELDSKLNGSWASSDENVAALGASPNADVVAIRNAVDEVLNQQFGNVQGYTNVYLDGRREMVRTRSTNLGNLSSDANLWYANLLSADPVHVSIKNGGGIRTEIGRALVPPGSVNYDEAIYEPPAANPKAGTVVGAITEGHLKATFRFDNGLVLLTATAAELKMLLEHGIASTEPGATPGAFPQVGGMKMNFDITRSPGERITSLAVTDLQGNVTDVLVADGVLQGSPSRQLRLVTLNFLANGGDGYPYDKLANPSRVNLYEGTGFGEDTDYPDANFGNDPGKNSSFSYTGGEQDAFAEYLQEFYGEPAGAFSMAENAMRIEY